MHLLIAEIVLVFHALTFSTSLYRVAAGIAAGTGLLLAARVGFRRESLPLFLPLLLGGILSLFYGAAPGPTIETIGVLAGAWGWFLAGSLRPTDRMEEVPRAPWMEQERPTDRMSEVSRAPWTGAPGTDASGMAQERPPASEAKGPRFGTIAAIISLMMAAAAIVHFLFYGAPPRFWMISPIDYAIATLLLGLLGRRAFTSRKFTLVFTAVILGGVVASTSRALLLASVTVLFLNRRAFSRRGVLICLLVLIAALPFAWRRVAGDALAWNRTRIYATATNLILERPLIGWGLGAFDSVSPRAMLPDPIEVRGLRRAVYAHCEPLELLVEIGLPLGVAVISATLLLAAGLLRRASINASAPFIATLVIGLFYFPLRLVFPLFAALFAAGGALPDRPGRFRIPIALCSLPIFLYTLGVMLENPRLAPFNARLAIEAGGDAGVSRMLALEPERPEAHANLAIFAARRGESGGAVRGFEAAAGRAPGNHSLRFELARACLWHGAEATDPEEAVRFCALGRRHLRMLRVLEPLSLAGNDAAGDTLGFLLADLRLDQIERLGEPERNIRLLRRRLEPELLR